MASLEREGGRGLLVTLALASQKDPKVNGREQASTNAIEIEGMNALGELMETTAMKGYLQANVGRGFAVKSFSEFRTLSDLREVLKSERTGACDGLRLLINFGNCASTELKGASQVLDEVWGKGIRVFRSPGGPPGILVAEIESMEPSKKKGENRLSLDLFDLEPDAGRESPLKLDLDLPKMEE